MKRSVVTVVGLALLLLSSILIGPLAAVLAAPLPSYIVISFADGLTGTCTYGYPTLARRGYEGVAFIPTAMVGTPKHMPVQNLQQLDAAGWDMASHLDIGADCTQLPPDELYSRLVASHDWLVDHGFARGARIFGPPAQKWNLGLTPLAVQAGYKVVVVGLKRGGLVPGSLNPVFQSCANKNDIGAISYAISKAAATPGTMLILSFHNIVAANPIGTDADIARLNAVLDLVAQSGLPVVTLSDLLDG